MHAQVHAYFVCAPWDLSRRGKSQASGLVVHLRQRASTFCTARANVNRRFVAATICCTCDHRANCLKQKV